MSETSQPIRTRRRLIVVGSALALVALVIVAEFSLRAIIRNEIEQNVRSNFGFSADQPIEVQLHGSSLLPALSGRVGAVDISIPNVTVAEGIEATLRASADSMPFDPSTGEIVNAKASVTIPASSMDEVVKLATNGVASSGRVKNGEIAVGTTLNLFGVESKLSTTLALSVQSGDVLITPTSVQAAGFDLKAEQIKPLLGEASAGLIDNHVVCVRNLMPVGIELTNIALTQNPQGGAATVSVSIAQDIFSNPAQMNTGTC